MPKRRPTPLSAPGKPPKADSRQPGAEIVRTSLYLPQAVHGWCDPRNDVTRVRRVGLG